LLHVCRTEKKEKLLQYAKRVWNITNGSETEIINEAIQKTREFFESLNVKTVFAEYGIGEKAVTEVLGQLKRHGLTALGERQSITLEVSEKILKASVNRA
jgi:NADP-dependent alcohol dehydrogenase